MSTHPHLSRRTLLSGATLAAATLLPVATAAGAAAAGTPASPSRSGRQLRLRLPAPTSPYRVGTTTLHWVDHSRHDPYVTEQPYRELMVTVTYPARDTDGHSVAGWLTPGWAANTDEIMASFMGDLPPSLVDWAGARAHAYVDAPAHRTGGRRLPVLLHTVGHWASYCFNRAAIEDLASRGYVVVTFDPTYETPVLFPGGRMVPVSDAASPPNDDPTSAPFLAYIRHIYRSRVDDARFVLDQLTAADSGRRPRAARLPRGLAGALDLTRVGAFSGAIGAGLFSLQLALEDPRVTAAFVGDLGISSLTTEGPVPIMPVVEQGLDCPVLAINPTSGYADPDPLWDTMWSGLRGWRRELELLDGGPVYCTDGQWFLPQLQRGLDIPRDVHAGLIGTVNPEQAVAASRAYLAAFFDLHLRGRDNHLLDRQSPHHPVIRFVR
jgi:hypothetical protein